MTRTLPETIEMLKDDYSYLKSWEAVAQQYGVTKPVVYRMVCRGYEPKDPHIRLKLGMPVYVPAPACPQCGDVHVYNEACGARQVTIVKAAAPVAAPVVVVRQAATPRKSRRRWKVDLPGSPTSADRELINSLTPAERLAALRQAAEEKSNHE
ncbi:MAG TPA: hypothetical protein PKD55_20230 [Bellilinea sp.]|nr:hypothetical protein [Bellilinea sp.]